jgi:ligand-binding SRPBCC domain-containing protein
MNALMDECFSTSQWVPFPLELVFAFFANPYNLPSLMPAKMRTRIERVHWAPAPGRPEMSRATRPQPDVAGVGTEIAVTFCPVEFVPLRLRWVVCVREFEWHSHFADEQIAGPFAQLHHRHRFAARMEGDQAGTTITDDIEFRMPLGPVGRLWSKAVRRQMESTFAMRQKRLPEVLGDLAARMA